MKKIMVFLLFLFACSNQQFPSNITIAWSGPLTGEFKELGTDNLRGVMIAVDEINKAGGVVRGDGVRVMLRVDSRDVNLPTVTVHSGDVSISVQAGDVFLLQGSRQMEFPFEGALSESVLQTYVRLYQMPPNNTVVVSSGYDVVQMLARRIVIARSVERIIG